MKTVRRLAERVRSAMEAHPKGMPLNDKGQLVPDPVPMEPPIGYKSQPSMIDIIRDQVMKVSQDAARQGYESEEQADDFDVGDEPELRSPYELDEESEVPIKVLKARADQAQLDYLEAKRQAGLRMQEDGAVGATSLPEGRKGPEAPPKPVGSPPEGGPTG